MCTLQKKNALEISNNNPENFCLETKDLVPYADPLTCLSTLCETIQYNQFNSQKGLRKGAIKELT